MSSLSQRLANNEKILIDGGTGTELEVRDVPMVKEAWTAAACLTHPEVVQTVHEEYLAAGAEMIIANTYACTERLLSDAGMMDSFEDLNRIGIELAQAARAKAGATVPIASSISTTDMMRGHPDPDSVRDGYRRQAEIHAATGADLIILEMMREITHTLVALEGAKSVGLPVWVGLSCIVKDGDVYLYDGTDLLSDMLIALKDKGVELVAIMHTLTQDVDACLDVMDKHWDGHVGVYAHSGDFIPPKWQFIDMISPEDYAANCERWLKRGVQVIGGCCGIGPAHIQELNKRWDTIQN